MSGPQSFWVADYILPGAAISVLFGNLIYSWMAYRLARQEQRSNVTALPYGINTPSLLVYVYYVMGPAYDKVWQHSGDADAACRAAFQAGLIACLGSGLIETFGAIVAGAIRRRTPRAALLSTLAGIAIGFIAMQFALQIYDKPLIAMVPLAIILLTYFSNISFPANLPGGLLAILSGTCMAWGITWFTQMTPSTPNWVAEHAMDIEHVVETWKQLAVHYPQLALRELALVITDYTLWLNYLSIIIPMGVFNLIGSLQNLESAEAAGDQYPTSWSLAVNGLGTLLAACFGSCFPTTIYIGHPGWKALGARSGYSTLNGIAITILCISGAIPLIHALIPLEAGVAIVLWIGIIITAQAFSATPQNHGPAVALGLFPAIAAWGFTLCAGLFFVNGKLTLQELLQQTPHIEINGYLLRSLVIIERGFIFTCMILAAIASLLIERKFFSASVWCFIATLSVLLGIIHAYQITDNAVDFLFVHMHNPDSGLEYRAYSIATGYALMGILFLCYGLYYRHTYRLKAAGHYE